MTHTKNNNFFYLGGDITKADMALINICMSNHRHFIRQGKKVPQVLVDGMVLLHNNTIKAEVMNAPKEEMDQFYEWWNECVQAQMDIMDLPRQLRGRYMSAPEKIKEALSTGDTERLKRAQDNLIILFFIKRALIEGREASSVQKNRVDEVSKISEIS